MKATLEFDLDDYDDAMAHMRCVKALDMAIALFDILNMKGNLKHKLENLDKDASLDLIFDAINDAVDERFISINALIQ